jgi:hypothetical protein
MRKPSRLTQLQLAFVGEYLKDHNASRAWTQAYYLSRGKAPPKKAVAKVNAHRVLTSPAVQAELQRTLEVQQRKRDIAAPDECLAAWTRDLRFDPADLVDEDGVPLPVHLIPERARLSLSGCDIQVVVYEPANGKGEVRRQTRYTYKYPEKSRAIAGLVEFLCGKAGGSREQILERIGVLVSSTVNVQVNSAVNSFGQDRARELLAMFAPKPAESGEPEVIDVVQGEPVEVETEGRNKDGNGSDETHSS